MEQKHKFSHLEQKEEKLTARVPGTSSLKQK
jgi:hypothetical protein